MRIRLLVLFLVMLATAALTYAWHYAQWPFALVFVPALLGFAFLFWGVVNINSQVFVKTECDFVPQGKEVILTFDDGPDPEKTPQILSLLEKYGAKGVFFVIGQKVDAHPEVARLLLENGHVIGSHSYFHGYLFDILSPAKVADELQKTETAIRKATGADCRFFRPPYGITNPNIAKALLLFNYRVLGWNLRSLDTVIHEPQKLERRVMKRIRPGSMILLHDTAPAVLPVLESLLVYLKENGYRTRLP